MLAKFNNFTASPHARLGGGVSRIISVGIDLASSRRAIGLTEQHAGIYATVGVHPHTVAELGPGDYAELRGLCRHAKVVAYCEIGLDYVKNYAPFVLQKAYATYSLPSFLSGKLKTSCDLTLHLVHGGICLLHQRIHILAVIGEATDPDPESVSAPVLPH